jgi:hypothetical protein
VLTASTTDYDAPRRSTIEDAETESLDAIKTARADEIPHIGPGVRVLDRIRALRPPPE